MRAFTSVSGIAVRRVGGRPSRLLRFGYAARHLVAVRASAGSGKTRAGTPIQSPDVGAFYPALSLQGGLWKGGIRATRKRISPDWAVSVFRC